MSEIDTLYEKKHLRNLNIFSARVRALYERYVDRIFRAAVAIKVPEGQVFDINKHPAFIRTLNTITGEMKRDLEVTIVNGVQQSWSLSNAKNDEWIEMLIKGKDVSEEIKRRFFNKNIPAMKAFIDRKTDGINLSDRVWKKIDQFRPEIEAGLQLGISDGKPAAQMASEMKRYLQDPDRLFRRVRDKHGNLKLSKPAQDYHPGQGRYRSSYRNALRLTRTETNMSYRNADHERWKGMKGVLGFEVKLSGSHRVIDICDDLKGKYPKEFKFNGWHPQCLCYAVPIRPTEEQFGDYLDSIMDGEDKDFQFTGEVQSVPEGMKNWLVENKEAVSRWKNTPYWIKDNYIFKITPKSKDPFGGSSSIFDDDELSMAGNKLNTNDISLTYTGYRDTIKKQLKGDNWGSLLSKDEIRAISDYTGGSFRGLNENLRFGKRDVGDFNNLDDTLGDILTRAPKSRTTCYRGIKFDTKEQFNKIVDEYNVGDIVVDKGYMSTSIDKGTADRFLGSSEYKILLEIKGKSGVDITGISEFKTEAELLFNKNSKFIIESVSEIEKNRAHIKLIEL